jgi:uncharacterized protein YbjT (DUF2867 family)
MQSLQSTARCPAANANKGDALRILLTGATGYVGGRLLPLLETTGHSVRCFARRPEALAARVAPDTEVVEGDVLDRAQLDAAMSDVNLAYYLVHSMGSVDFEETDRIGARQFGEAARAADVRGIVYLGGILSPGADLSAHLRSRREVGEILRSSGVPVLEFRASIIIGTGSLSFALIRALVERLPLMITPRWVRVMAQPIAIDDVLEYLLAALALPVSQYRVVEIGGADRVSYADIMRAYARVRGLRRVLLPVPVLTPYLSSLWLGLVTPLYARVGRKLIESIVHPTVVTDDTALRMFPIRPMGIVPAIERALRGELPARRESRWSDALSSGGQPLRGASAGFGKRLTDARVATVPVAAERAFEPIRRIGGESGWYGWRWLWRVRGALDLVAGGVGMRRGRSHPTDIWVGDAIDFWRVEAYEPGKRLRLSAEMKLPGRAWLEFVVQGDEESSAIMQTATFDPAGWAGRLYWFALLPFHNLVFGAMLRGIVTEARRGPELPN